jgi:phospholipid transport system transporter-binding protein
MTRSKEIGIVKQNGRLMVSGDLNFKTVPTLWMQSLPLLAEINDLHFDFEQIRFSNSAGIALMIEWMKYAKDAQKNISFHHIPLQLDSIINATGVNVC